MQTQFLYSKTEKRIEDVDLYRICYPVSYQEYLQYQKEGNVKCSNVQLTKNDFNTNDFTLEIFNGKITFSFSKNLLLE